MHSLELEHKLLADLEGTIEAAKKRDYVPAYFLQMLARHGAVETAKRLLSSEEPQEGLFRLYELGLLHESLEAVVLKPEYKSLFSDNHLATARKRLEDLNYPLE